MLTLALISCVLIPVNLSRFILMGFTLPRFIKWYGWAGPSLRFLLILVAYAYYNA